MNSTEKISILKSLVHGKGKGIIQELQASAYDNESLSGSKDTSLNESTIEGLTESSVDILMPAIVTRLT